ncbi:MAG TPA: DUF6799 domain-containing protein [Chryseosolibacter sp.]
MKRTIYLALLLIGYSLRAQDLTQLRDRDQIREYLKFEDKDLLPFRDQDRIHLTEITLLDGTVVNADGTHRTADGDRLRLRDGECMDLDGNKYASEEQFRQQLQYRLQTMNQLHFALRDGNAFQQYQNRLMAMADPYFSFQNRKAVQESKPGSGPG